MLKLPSLYTSHGTTSTLRYTLHSTNQGLKVPQHPNDTLQTTTQLTTLLALDADPSYKNPRFSPDKEENSVGIFLD